MNDHTAIPPHACPRCDYDLAGIVPAHTQAVGQGRCPECGLEFDWKDVLEPAPPPPAWSLEPAPGVRWSRAMDRAGRVVRRVVTPAALWQRPGAEWRPVPAGLMLAHPVRAGGLLATACLGFAVAWLAAAVLGGAMGMALYGLEVLEDDASSGGAWSTYPSIGLVGVWNTWERIRFSVLAPGVPWISSSGAEVLSMLTTACILFAAVLMPASMLLLGSTLRRSHVRWRHLWRLAAYAAVQLPLLGLLCALPGALGRLMLHLDACVGAMRLAGNAGSPKYSWAADRASSSVLAFARWVDLRGCAVFLQLNGSFVAAALAVFWLWSYWRRGSALYLRLPRAGLDASILLFTALLAGVAALAVLAAVSSKWLGLRY